MSGSGTLPEPGWGGTAGSATLITDTLTWMTIRPNMDAPKQDLPFGITEY